MGIGKHPRKICQGIVDKSWEVFVWVGQHMLAVAKEEIWENLCRVLWTRDWKDPCSGARYIILVPVFDWYAKMDFGNLYSGYIQWGVSGQVPDQDIPFDLILWYVSKTIYFI